MVLSPSNENTNLTNIQHNINMLIVNTYHKSISKNTLNCTPKSFIMIEKIVSSGTTVYTILQQQF